MNNPATLMIVWQILALILLIVIIRFIYRYFTRNKRKDLLLLMCLMGITAVSCKKENIEQKSELLEQLGIQNYTIEKSTTAKPVSFNDMETLKAYLQVVREETPYKGNTHKPKQLKKHIDEMFIMAWLSKSAIAREGEADDDYGQWYNAGTGSPRDGTPSLTRWVFWSGYNVTFNYKNTNGVNEVTDFNSGLVGIHLGVSWEHQSGSGQIDPKTGIITFTVQGIQNYNILFQGLGTLFSTPVELMGTYNPATGDYTITIKYPKKTNHK